MPEVTRVSEIVVVGKRITYTYAVPDYLLPKDEPQGEADELPDDPGGYEVPCVSTANMSDAEKLQTLLRFAAAVWREQVRDMAVQNVEWGTAFYIDSQGNLKNTSFMTSPNHTAAIRWSDLPNLPSGEDDYGSVVSIAHTHPRYNYNPTTGDPSYDYYDPNDPDRLLRPSPGRWENGLFREGDWATWDSVRTLANYQQEHLGGSGPRPELSLLIVGFDGNDLAINQYTAADQGYTSKVSGTGANDGTMGSRGAVGSQPLPPCSE